MPDGQRVAGVMKPPPDIDGLPDREIYFAANDVDAMVVKVKQLGGAVDFGPMDIPHSGRVATGCEIVDAQGFAIGLGGSRKQPAHRGETS